MARVGYSDVAAYFSSHYLFPHHSHLSAGRAVAETERENLQQHRVKFGRAQLTADLIRAPSARPSLAESLGRDDILLFVELLAAGALAAALPLTLLLRLAAQPASAPRRDKMYGAHQASNKSSFASQASGTSRSPARISDAAVHGIGSQGLSRPGLWLVAETAAEKSCYTAAPNLVMLPAWTL